MEAVRRAALALVFSCFAGLSALGMVACSFDWSVRRAPDADADAAVIIDASDEPVDATATEDTSFEAGQVVGDGAPTCADLEAAINKAETNARACTLGAGQCMMTVKDQCDCAVYIAVPNSSAANKLTAAVTTYLNSCTPSCSGCPVGAVGSCLQHGDGGIFCYPP